MTIQETRRLLDGFLAGITSLLGFQHTGCLEFARQANDAIALLSWPCRLDQRGFSAFTCNVGLRFEGLAKWLSDDPKELVATAGTPIHFLRETKNFTEWKFSNAGDLEGLRETILSDLNNFAIPFFERYSQLARLRQAVESSNSRDWINLGLDQDRRVNVLAAIQLVQGEKVDAIRTLDEALAERKTALPKRRFEIEYLRKRIAEAG